MTLAGDSSPAIGRPTYLAVWRELADGGTGVGPVILSAVTSLAGLGPGIIVSGLVGFAAAAALWRWIPKHAGMEHRRSAEQATEPATLIAEAESD
jgi:hypothetical protein